jgi:hypothetical protein
MIELKVHCDCGQKFKFDVEPVNNRMPFTVACPICGVDGTSKANGLLQAQAPALPAASVPSPCAPPPPPRAPAALRINMVAPVAAEPPPMPPRVATVAAATAPRVGAVPVRPAQAGLVPTNLGLGLLGALMGAGTGAGLMYGFFAVADFRFPLLGTGVGALTGLGARILFRGTDNALGAISAAVAAVAVIGTLYVMYGEFPIMNIISVIVSIGIAYKVAS